MAMAERAAWMTTSSDRSGNWSCCMVPVSSSSSRLRRYVMRCSRGSRRIAESLPWHSLARVSAASARTRQKVERLPRQLARTCRASSLVALAAARSVEGSGAREEAASACTVTLRDSVSAQQCTASGRCSFTSQSHSWPGSTTTQFKGLRASIAAKPGGRELLRPPPPSAPSPALGPSASLAPRWALPPPVPLDRAPGLLPHFISWRA
mmetsp:Transcript_40650/g.96595  ORF Transcript_40650/g.96595 Transcript_40650/m.96595 type:complete len:208 (-) Transcript_40650:1870-2493(-)